MSTKRVRSNFVNEEINPCMKESELSVKCLEDHGYEQEKCVHYFKNYQVCKQFWGKVYNVRRVKGIRPFMPGSEEREKILKEVDEGNKFVYAAV